MPLKLPIWPIGSGTPGPVQAGADAFAMVRAPSVAGELGGLTELVAEPAATLPEPVLTDRTAALGAAALLAAAVPATVAMAPLGAGPARLAAAAFSWSI